MRAMGSGYRDAARVRRTRRLATDRGGSAKSTGSGLARQIRHPCTTEAGASLTMVADTPPVVNSRHRRSRFRTALGQSKGRASFIRFKGHVCHAAVE